VEFAAYEITPPQFVILAHLWKRDAISQTELSEITKIDRTTIGGIIDRLSERGLVERQSQTGDRRVHRIILTTDGKDLENELCMAAIRVRDNMTTRILPSEYTALQQILKKLCES
jgi:DNA-binding MarR family transcriptional regulator